MRRKEERARQGMKEKEEEEDEEKGIKVVRWRGGG